MRLGDLTFMLYDVIVVGAGIVGLATARELNQRYPSLNIAVLDKEQQAGQHQSGHNSGVLHAGVYYKPGSLKARLCVEGKERMEAFARHNDVPFDSCGKLIVALDETELPALEELRVRAEANGVPGLRVLDGDGLREIEPHAAGIRALHSPGTGIIDFAQVTTVLADQLRAAGVTLLLGHEVTGLENRTDSTVVHTSRGDVSTKALITCAGLYSDRVAGYDSEPDVQIVPFRGDYYTLKPEARHLCRGLIYPVPDASLPFLGVHFTKRIDGNVWAGPNAVFATRREGYRRTDIEFSELAEALRWPGLWKLGKKYWKSGAGEMWRDAVKPAFVKELQRYVPAIQPGHLTFGPSGVRAQALGRDGAMVDDFKLVGQGRSMHVLNAPSPAATASLAIAGELVNRAAEHLDLGPGSQPKLV